MMDPGIIYGSMSDQIFVLVLLGIGAISVTGWLLEMGKRKK